MNPEVTLAVSDEEISACFPVMSQLRTHLEEAYFVSLVRSQESEGYRLAYVAVDDQPAAVAGFRISHHLAYGRTLYVDDLVTARDRRSSGLGKLLLDWLASFAREQGCTQLHLDSGTQRRQAHRFYHREGLEIINFHFAKQL